MAQFTCGGLARLAGTFVLTAMLCAGGAPGTAGDDGRAAIPRYFTINEVVAALDGEANPQAIRVAAPAASSAGQIETAPAAESLEPFGLFTFRAPEGLLWAKWRKLVAELDDELQLLDRCKADRTLCPGAAAEKFLALVGHARRLNGRARIAYINRSINAAVRYMTDPDQYGVDDRWSPPLATLESGLGDCEDYAIAKYAALREAGYAAEDVRLLVVRDRLARQDHAVAAVRESGRWIMLDNRHDVLLERKDAWHFTPMFALDREGVRLFAAPYGAPPSAPPQVASGAATRPLGDEREGADADGLGLRLDTFEKPLLRGGL